jgi:UDP-glucose 4-epimerase
MARWVRQHGARSSQMFENIEITKNFPQAWREEQFAALAH